MKGIKKGLAILLVVCMMLSMVVMVGASAPDVTGKRPADGTTTSQPFSQNTGGSANFRIPALVTLSDGTLVAAADARWNTTSDGYGLDTIVSRSSDGGATWNYTFANYLGDNGNVANSDSTAFIDPALAVASDNTIYMLVDIYPHGTYIGNVKAGTGFDGNGRLMLRTSSGSNYDYYVGDFTDGSANIYKTDGTQVSGYTVDEYFNITGNNVNTNLFFSDSPYQVLSTSYLYLTKSTDGGATWSAPMMLNSQVKGSGEYFYGVGPGGSIVTSTGRIIFPCYTYANGADGKTSVIYSDDGGETWMRSADMNVQTSEASISEVTLNGQKYLYMFTRHGGYFVSSDNGTTWSNQKSSGISYTTSCELSTLTYSKTINGRPAILLSAPTNNRTTGKIFVGLVQDDQSINWTYTYAVNGSGTYQYSDLAELSDGSIGLLYEDGSASITYKTISIAEIATGATIGDSTEPATVEKDVTLLVGQSKTFTDTTGNYEGSYTDSGLNTGIAIVDVTGSTTMNATAALGTNSTYSGGEIALSDCLYTFTASGSNWVISSKTSDGATVYLNITGNSSANYPQSTTSHTISIIDGTVEGFTFQDQVTGNGGKTLYFWRDGNKLYFDRQGSTATTGATDFLIFRPANAGENTSNSAIPGYVAVTSTEEIKNGGQYLIAASYNGSYYVLHPSTSTTDKYSHVAKVTGESASADATTITITGVAAGTTSVVVGNTKYNITVLDAADVIYDTLELNAYTTETISVIDLGDGQTVEWTVENPAYAYISATKENTATVYGRAEGNTNITAVVYNSDGSVAQTYVWDTTVTAGNAPNAGNYDVTFKFDCTIYNGTLYYSIDGGPLKKAMIDTTANDGASGEVGTTYTVQESDQNVAYASIVWFVEPNEGYAVTTVYADSKSYSQFYAIDKETETIEVPSTHQGGKLQDFLETEQQDALFHEAVGSGCDAVFWNSMGSKSSRLTEDKTREGTYVIHCDKLPTVEKEITSITRSNGTNTPYEEGMTINLGDTINYTITVSYYDVTSGSIIYTNLSLIDELTDGSKNLISATSKTVSTKSTETYYTSLKVDMSNYAQVVTDGEIVNTVDLTYDYQSSYSIGSYGGSASAEASITIAQPEYVIDFGLPVTIDLNEFLGDASISGGTAHYGTITSNGTSFTYTPTQTLKGTDYVVLTLANNVGSFGVTIYPATTVYYEEGFATYSEKVTDGTNKGTTNQTTSAVGAGKTGANYGYDSAYNAVGDSNGTVATMQTGAQGMFEFTGTGVDIYAQTGTATGKVMVYLYQGIGENKTLKRLITVDTRQLGDLSAEDTAYNVPIVSLSGLTHGEYTIRMLETQTKFADGTKQNLPVYIDGFRVHGTLDVNFDVYSQDNEANPTFVELRNSVLKAEITDETSTSQYANQIADTVMSQVYAANEKGIDALVVTKGTNKIVDVQDLLDNGPKNEIYLRTGESLIFTVNADSAQIGLKALNAATSYTINNGAVQNLSASTDMFYPLTLNSNGTTTITITNNGGGILSITELKLFGADTSTASVEPLSAPALTRALMSLGFEAEPVPATATLNITVQCGDKAIPVVLTAEGMSNETHTFTAAEIKAAVEQALPEGYTVADVTFSDVTVACGEASEVSFTAAEVPAPVGLFQKIVQTAVKIVKKIFSWF